MNNIILFGDIVIDVKIDGTSSRIAPEGPFPIVNIKNKSKKLGCCGNVLFNILDFFDNIYLITCINENEINEIKEIITNYRNVKLINFNQDNRHIIRKNRLYYNNTCISRFDDEIICDIDTNNEINIIKYIESIIYDINIIILSDYNKGTLTNLLTLKILELTRKHNVISLIDPKTTDFSKYKNATIVKPNKKEFQECLEYEKINKNDDMILIQNNIVDKYNINFILNTLGDEGMRLLFKNNGSLIEIHTPTIKSYVLDVLGCGDTIIGGLAVYLSKAKYNMNSINYKHMLKTLCKVGKLAVETSGCYNLNTCDWKKCYNGSECVVFTNGCFDIIHIGHIKLLKECKKIGDKLIIGINSDESIKRLKGDTRPINGLQDRITFLNELNIADEIIPFDEDTPVELIKKIKPNILVKGGDYKKEEVMGKEYVDDVVILKFYEGYSTTKIIDHIIDNIKR